MSLIAFIPSTYASRECSISGGSHVDTRSFVTSNFCKNATNPPHKSAPYVRYDSDPLPLFSYDSFTCGINFKQIIIATTTPMALPYHAIGAHSPARCNTINAGAHAHATITICNSTPALTAFFIDQSTPPSGVVTANACSLSSTYAYAIGVTISIDSVFANSTHMNSRLGCPRAQPLKSANAFPLSLIWS